MLLTTIVFIGFMVRCMLLVKWHTDMEWPSTKKNVPKKDDVIKIMFIPFYWWYYYGSEFYNKLD